MHYYTDGKAAVFSKQLSRDTTNRQAGGEYIKMGKMISEDRLRELYNIYIRNQSVSTDSRSAPPDSIFFALKGDNFDGNRFAAQALAAGAAIAVVDDPEAAATADGQPEKDGKLFVVEDALEALQALAAHHRRQLSIPILAITGTNGKTTTKELMNAVLSRKYNVYATKGNLNNHIGVPLTLLSMTCATEFGIVEMGASSQGEIALLCGIAEPDYGLITNIGRAHLEGFGGEDGVRKTKGELYDWLAATGGMAFVRRDDPVLAGMAAERAIDTGSRKSPGMKVYEYDVSLADGMESNLEGDYNRFNIAAAVAAGSFFGIGPDEIRSAVRDYVPGNNRSQLIDTGRNILVADCYNANPSSMKAAISNFAGHDWKSASGAVLPRIAILGDMHELGRWSEEEHSGVAENVTGSNISKAWFVGNNFHKTMRKLQSNSSAIEILTFKNINELKEHIIAYPISNAAILLKGSRAEKLENIIELL